MTFVYLPGGTFKMGSNSDPVASPEHEVILSPFWIARYEVTNTQFDSFKKRKRYPESLGNNQPAVRVPWKDAQAFCDWMGQKDGLKYRLPTEAEWEYAARGGLEGMDYPWGNDLDPKYATFARTTTTPIGTYPCNYFSLCDMAGNAGEWVSDLYSEDYYQNSPLHNPRGPKSTGNSSDERIYRGGFWGIWHGEVFYRGLMLNEANTIPGFRVVLEQPQGKLSSLLPKIPQDIQPPHVPPTLLPND